MAVTKKAPLDEELKKHLNWCGYRWETGFAEHVCLDRIGHTGDHHCICKSQVPQEPPNPEPRVTMEQIVADLLARVSRIEDFLILDPEIPDDRAALERAATWLALKRLRDSEPPSCA